MQAQNLLKNQSKQDKDVSEVSPRDVHDQQPQTDLGIIPITDPSPLHQQPNQSKRNKLKRLWFEAEDMILVVASLIATVDRINVDLQYIKHCPGLIYLFACNL